MLNQSSKYTVWQASATRPAPGVAGPNVKHFWGTPHRPHPAQTAVMSNYGQSRAVCAVCIAWFQKKLGIPNLGDLLGWGREVFVTDGNALPTSGSAESSKACCSGLRSASYRLRCWLLHGPIKCRAQFSEMADIALRPNHSATNQKWICFSNARKIRKIWKVHIKVLFWLDPRQAK